MFGGGVRGLTPPLYNTQIKVYICSIVKKNGRRGWDGEKKMELTESKGKSWH